MRSMRNNSGQSLVEVLVAITMGVMLLSALVIATTKSIKSSRFARDKSQATHLAKQRIEELRNIRDEQGWGALVGQGEVEQVVTDAEGEQYAKIRVEITVGEATAVQETSLSKWAY